MGDRHNIPILIGLMIVFAAIFFVSYAGLEHEQALFDIGIPPLFENWLIMFLSIGSIIRIVWELYKK
jgi:hypothetical protein